jgi:competence protein ComEC
MWLPVLYGAGAGAYFSLTIEPSMAAALAPVPAALVAWLVFRRGTMAVVATAMALLLTLGFAAAKSRTAWVAAPVLERPLNLVEVRGWVELVEPRAGRGQRLTLRLVSIRGVPQERLPYRARIRTMTALADLAPGDAVRLRATVAAPALPALPGDYDFARSAYFLRLGAIGYALARPERDESLGPAPLSLRIEAAVAGVRQAISRRVRQALPGETGAIADALITGERGGISAATNAAYRDSGLFHILSISGLHMTIMAGAVFLALRLVLAAIPAVVLRCPVKKIAAAVATVAALGYLLISGASFATVRAWVMISIMFLAVLLDRPAIALRNVAVSALLILLVLPESLLDVGFQMSFAAVVALVAAFEMMRDRRADSNRAAPRGPVLGSVLFLGAIVLTTLIASLAVAPFAAYHFHKSQQYAVLANLIAIPVCNIVVMPAALATLVVMPLGMEAVPLWVMGWGIDAMSWVAAAVAGLPGAVGRLPAVSLSAFLAMVTGGLWLCIWRTRWRLLGIVGIAAGLGLAPTLSRPDVLVGRDGLAVAVRATDGRLGAVVQRGAQFELARWLEHDGDGRQPREVAKAQDGFRCDAAGCTARAKGALVVLSRHPSGLADDCARAALLILTYPRPRACGTVAPAIDLYDLRDKGGHAVYVSPAGLRIETVADVRGERPWTRWGRTAHRAGASRGTAGTFVVPAGGGASTSRLGQFAPPFDLSGEETRRRPEIEEDDETDLR